MTSKQMSRLLFSWQWIVLRRRDVLGEDTRGSGSLKPARLEFTSVKRLRDEIPMTASNTLAGNLSSVTCRNACIKDERKGKWITIHAVCKPVLKELQD
jgi:hypothetical protein